jgi:surface protein
MFVYCTNLKSLDLSSFKTGKATIFANMFRSCNSLTSLDLSNFDLSEATNMGSMFNNCTSLNFLDISNANSNKCNWMGNLFWNCYSLKSLNLTGFRTNNVYEMDNMFRNCTSLELLDLSGFNVKARISNIFADANNIKYIRLDKYSGKDIFTSLTYPKIICTDDFETLKSKYPTLQNNTENDCSIYPYTVTYTNKNESVLIYSSSVTREEIIDNPDDLVKIMDPDKSYYINGNNYSIVIKPLNETVKQSTVNINFDACEKKIKRKISSLQICSISNKYRK